MLLQVEAVGLAALSVVLAGPASAALARAQWPARAPRAALVLWQAIGLGGGLGVLSAGLTLASGSLADRWLAGVTGVPGVVAVPSRWSELDGWGWFGVGLTACVGMWLVGVAISSGVRVSRARRTHRQRLELIAGARRVPGAGRGVGGGEVFLVEHPSPAAYCLPGLRPRVVVTRGALSVLTGAQVAAVLGHERAHAIGRHDLVVQPFIAWVRTLPFLPSARAALQAVGLLVEMHADDLALRECRPGDLAAALRRIRASRAPGGAGAVAGTGAGGTGAGAPEELMARTAERLARLEHGSRPLPVVSVLAVYLGAAALVLLPPLVLVLS